MSTPVRPVWLRPLPLAAFLTPVIAVPSGRGLVSVLIILGIWALWEDIRAGRLGATYRGPLVLWTVTVAAFGAISAAWALMPMNAVHASLKFAALAVAGLPLLAAGGRLDNVERHSTETALLIGVAVATAFLWAGTIYGIEMRQPLWGTPGQHPIRALSQSQTVIAVFAVPALYILWRRGLRYLVLALGIAIGFAFLRLEHEASTLGIAAAGVALIFVLVTGSRGAIVVGVSIALVILAMPIIIDIALPPWDVIRSKTGPSGSWPDELHREYMWRFVLDNIAGDNYWSGHGMDASRGFPGAKDKIMWGIELMPLHPHNGALQAWLELGPLGAVLAVGPALLAAMAARTFHRQSAAVIAAILCAYAVPWLVSYGIWQSWWLALAWLAAAVGTAICREPRTNG